MTTTIYFIRHAQSLHTQMQDYSMWPLSPAGEDQAKMLAGLLKPLGIEYLYSSPFLRCLQTIAPFMKAADVDVDIRQDLREQLVADVFMEGFIDIWRKCWADFSYSYPGCESCHDAQHRFASEIIKILKENGKKTIGISAHGMVISLFLNYIDSTFTRKNSEQLKTPHVFRVICNNDQMIWDQDFHLTGIDEISSEYKDTPVKNKPV